MPKCLVGVWNIFMFRSAPHIILEDIKMIKSACVGISKYLKNDILNKKVYIHFAKLQNAKFKRAI